MPVSLDRRQLLAAGGAGIATSFVGTTTQSARAAEQAVPRFGYCLNMSTIRAFDGKGGTPRPIVEQIEIAAKAATTRLSRGCARSMNTKRAAGV